MAALVEPDRRGHRAGIIAGNAPARRLAVRLRGDHLQGDAQRMGDASPSLRAADHGKLASAQQRVADHERGLADAGETEPTPIQGHGATEERDRGPTCAPSRR